MDKYNYPIIFHNQYYNSHGEYDPDYLFGPYYCYWCNMELGYKPTRHNLLDEPQLKVNTIIVNNEDELMEMIFLLKYITYFGPKPSTVYNDDNNPQSPQNVLRECQRRIGHIPDTE